MENTTLRRFLALLAVMGATTYFAAVTSAQPPARPGPPGSGRPGMRGPGGPGMPGGRRPITAAVLPVATLDAIVKLSPEQKSKITAIHDNFARSLNTIRPAEGQRPDAGLMQKLVGLNTQASQAIEAQLTAPQRTKLAAATKELELYRLAGIPFGLYGQIQLTPAQKTGLQQIQQSVSGPQANREARRGARDKAAALLTPAQKAQIEHYRNAHPNEGGGRRPGGP